ncbi:A disintegrin and metalloproteinase with thrombospondin motifs adt-1-like isoform X2 [Harmonia axyridis]|uniref:A disintegrin and metalloproteinase with thrombospondin motifs adt-1-like isoform X2 n=1 Tax=Harmonia axyridis TaxID=115357 RepID=UPI001E277B99|nr:A disintegrin and metalloproteinase with thrombospondin motifs adt-1-like isoform X2 [Harmonia axyridis]
MIRSEYSANTSRLLCCVAIEYDRLKEILTDNEWKSLLGNQDSQYFITNPSFEKLNNSSLYRLILPVPSTGQNITVYLLQNDKVLANNFVVLETYTNRSNVLNHNENDTNCHYKGENAAVSTCEGIRGVIHNDNKFYLIQPLPARLKNETHYPHILIEKHSDEVEPKNSSNYECSHSKIHGYTKETSAKKPNIHKAIRRKRENFPPGAPVFVETAVFVDRDLFDHMRNNFPVDTERELIRFVLAMVNAVQLLYHDPSLGRPVNFVLKRLEILKEEATGLARPPDIDRFLSNFCNWQRTKNPVGDKEPQHWDHALILTGLDLYVRGKHGKISTQVVGLAPVAGMCTSTSSCTVNEGRHFESVYVVAHEIGHNLGMRHDGPLADNDCDPTSYIMSPTLGSGKITWSSCSKRYLQKFLDTSQSRCLLDHGSSAGTLDHSAEGALPGERFDANQQCMLKYGSGSKHSSQQPLDDVCRDLHCERERYTWTSHPALEGTSCGHNLWCRGGRCMSKGIFRQSIFTHQAQKLAANSEKVNGGWSDWRPSSDCASGCLFGEEGRLSSGSSGIRISERFCNNPRPLGGGANCEGPERKFEACNAEQCINVPRLSVREFADQICTRAKEVDDELTGIGMQKITSSSDEACLVWCKKRDGGIKSRGWNFPDGTVCQTRRSRYGRANYCVSGRCEEFVCDSFDESPFVQMPDLCPVEREDNELLWKTGLRRRDTPTHWKSASGCHFNCISPGSGIRLVMSKGTQSKSSIQLCQADEYACGRKKSPFQHASMVCSKYKERVRRLSGLGMQISPVIEDPDRPCRVACQDENISHRFYLVNGEEGWFPFGTDCTRGSSDKKAYCISGKCLEFGSDGTPLSENEFTLPLLSRTKRSLYKNSNTRIIVKLDQKELDNIVHDLNRTISGQDYYIPRNKFAIDLDNPIHFNMDNETVIRYGNQDYINYA